MKNGMDETFTIKASRCEDFMKKLDEDCNDVSHAINNELILSGREGALTCPVHVRLSSYPCAGEGVGEFRINVNSSYRIALKAKVMLEQKGYVVDDIW